MGSKGNQSNGLRPGFTPLGIWAFSIGTSIGWGSFIVTCNTYLQKSGILGTVFGLLIGMAVIFVITWNLQYMIQKAPNAGGVYMFEKHVGGNDLGFLAFWFILLTYLAILWANITSVPLFTRFFLGDTFQVGLHYHIFGYEVYLGEALLSIAAVVIIGILCANSTRIPNHIMAVAALVFTIGFTVCAIIAMMRHDSGFSYSPMYTEGSTDFAQIVRIAAISPWAFIGFENISHFSEEYSFPIKKIRRILISSVLVTTLLYLFVSMLSISAYPPEYDSWLSYIQDMGNLEGIKAVPAFYAANYYLGQGGVTVLMLALLAVILTSLIGNMMALSRLLFAAGREKEAPQTLATLNKRGIPGKAILLVVLISAFIPFLGRTAIGWIVDVTTLGATLIYALISHAVYRHAQTEGNRRERCTGIIGMVLMVCFIVLLLIPGLLPFHAMETESYILFIVWAVIGLVYFRGIIRRDPNREHGQRVVVWGILLILVLFASMMWVSRETEMAAENAAERIFEYHESHPTDDSDPAVKAERKEFLKKQAVEIGSENTLYTSLSLGLFLIFIIMILNNARDARRLGERLSVAEKEAIAARKIADLKETIASLMENMPGMTFTKDARTGVYLACNKAFAEYAKKKDADGVIGLTDAQIFDKETAAHFVEDDRMALSMDKPYIFFEDVLDAAGNHKQFQTTKLKYTDSTDRLCILGMCQDVTDMVRIQRENAMTREAYERARNVAIIYTHIAQALAHGYKYIYYVDFDTEEFIEYTTDAEGMALAEERRGSRFFKECENDVRKFVYPEDQSSVIEALSRQTLDEALERNKMFIITYRRIDEGEYKYFSLRATRMEDDDRYIVLGVTDVDEEMSHRYEAERAREERASYARLNALSGELLCVYIVDPNTGHYHEYRETESFGAFGVPEEGEDFFGASRENGRSLVYPEDLDRYLSGFTKENIMEEIERSGVFALRYRLLINEEPVYVQLRAAMVEEPEGLRMVFGINDIDAQVRQEEEYARRLSKAQSQAHRDALTGVRNKHAYQDEEAKLNRQINEEGLSEFAIVVLDVNDLKVINDTEGHKSGDSYLRTACKLICDIFKHSPVFRVGGDEFAVIAQGSDYENIDELVSAVAEHNADAVRSGGVVVACGMARFENDEHVASVFERADKIMYDNKADLKAGGSE